MALLPRIFHTFWIGLIALILIVIPALLFIVAKSAQRYLSTPHQWGNIYLHVYQAQITPWFSFQADSMEFHSKEFRFFASKLTLQTFGGSKSWLQMPAIKVQFDSARVEILGKRQSKSETAKFPNLRFPLPVSLNWRAFRFKVSESLEIAADSGQWRNQGMLGLQGRTQAKLLLVNKTPIVAAITTQARWRGGNVRYKIQVVSGNDTLYLEGRKDKGNLALGEDSVALFVKKVSTWIPTEFSNQFPPIGKAHFHGNIDWKKRRILLRAKVVTGILGPFEAFNWKITLRGTPLGGSVDLVGESSTQEISWKGNWKHPESWLTFPNLNQSEAKFSGKVQGIFWQLGPHRLPIQANIPSVRLLPGKIIEAELVSADSSRMILRWDGKKPMRAECAGSISNRERWALIWTDTNVSFQSGFISAVWDHGKIEAKARLYSPYGYGGEGDSLTTQADIDPLVGIKLHNTRLYAHGETFHSSGFVRWGGKPLYKGVVLAFDLNHKKYGSAHFSMPFSDSLVGVLDGTQISHFPYRPLKKFARFRPYIEGQFAWNLVKAVGNLEAQASFTYGSKSMRAKVAADWNPDRLHLKEAEWVMNTSRLAVNGVTALGPKSLMGLKHFKPSELGAWTVAASNIHLSEILEFSGQGNSKIMGATVDGTLSSTKAQGLEGTMKVSGVTIPSIRGLFQIAELSVHGQGESLRLLARTISQKQPLLVDTLTAILMSPQSTEPELKLNVRGPLSLNWIGKIPSWKQLQGDLELKGKIPLGAKAGHLEKVILAGEFSMPFSSRWQKEMRFISKRLEMKYFSALDTQSLHGNLRIENGMLNATDIRISHSQGGVLQGNLEAGLSPTSIRAALQGPELKIALPGGRTLNAKELSAQLAWATNQSLVYSVSAGSGTFRMPQSPFLIEGGFDRVRIESTIPPEGSTQMQKMGVRGRITQFLFHHKMGFKDVESFFKAVKKNKRSKQPVVAKHTKPWELDIAVEAIGTQNRVDIDVLRMSFLGDLEVKGIYPYTLMRGKMTGIKGELGQPGRAYDVRDFELKWENSTVEEGSIYLEGDKKLKADCLASTQKMCRIGVKLDGTLGEMNFSYDTDCGQNEGETIPPSALINSVTQGCFSAPLQGGEGGKAMISLIEAPISEGLTKAGRRFSLGIIDKTKVTGLGSLMGSDSSSLESVALEVESKEKFRMSVQARAGYFPENDLPDPWEYRLSVKYRPPMERWVSDSSWQSRFKNRLHLEAGVQTQLDRSELDYKRRVSQQVGLRYRYRFWDLW